MILGTHTIYKKDLATLAGEILAFAKIKAGEGAFVIALHGDLGAGKTTLVQTIGATLAVAEVITSPTFTIMKQYDTSDADFETLVHMDAYRIDSLEELRPLRFSELLAIPKTLVCIEWAEKIKEMLPESILQITIEVENEDARTVHISY
jgi:tRNA threonylcarbamoyladenosine biosynthesis protein TsaE